MSSFRLVKLMHQRAELRRRAQHLCDQWESAQVRSNNKANRLVRAADSYGVTPRGFWMEATLLATQVLWADQELLTVAHAEGLDVSDQAMTAVQARWVAACKLREASRPSTGQHEVDITVMLDLMEQSRHLSVDSMLAILDGRKADRPGS